MSPEHGLLGLLRVAAIASGGSVVRRLRDPCDARFFLMLIALAALFVCSARNEPVDLTAEIACLRPGGPRTAPRSSRRRACATEPVCNLLLRAGDLKALQARASQAGCRGVLSAEAQRSAGAARKGSEEPSRRACVLLNVWSGCRPVPELSTGLLLPGLLLGRSAQVLRALLEVAAAESRASRTRSSPACSRPASTAPRACARALARLQEWSRALFGRWGREHRPMPALGVQALRVETSDLRR